MENPDQKAVPSILGAEKQNSPVRKLAIEFLNGIVGMGFNAKKKKEFYSDLCSFVGWKASGALETINGLDTAGIDGPDEKIAADWLKSLRDEVAKMDKNDPNAAIDAIVVRLEMVQSQATSKSD